jgi:hypothetical protein
MEHLTAHSVFVKHFKQQDLTNTVVVSPDIGNAKRASKLAHSLDVPLAIGQKQRISDENVNIGSVLGEVKGKRIVPAPDGTLEEANHRGAQGPPTAIVVALGLEGVTPPLWAASAASSRPAGHGALELGRRSW